MRFSASCAAFIVPAVLLVSAGPGCSIGPAAIRVSQAKYNDAIQYTTNEQLLLNLVRLRYRDVPFFLQVSSVSTQFEIDQSSDATVTVTENVGLNPINPTVLNVGGRMGYSERPTITITPLQGNEFVNRMLSSFDLDTIALLHTAGWSIDRVLTLTLSSMNHLANAPNASSPTPDDVPEFRDFARATFLLRELQKRQALFIGHDLRERDVSGPLPAAAVSADHVLNAARDGLILRRAERGDAYAVRRAERVLRIGVAESAREAPEWREVVSLLGLEPGQDRYDVVLSLSGLAESPRAERSREIRVSARSLLGTMFLVSHAIEVPERDRAAGLVTVTRDAAGNEFDWLPAINHLLRIRVYPVRPLSCAVAVSYRGHWFYIDDADRNSKATFLLLAQLFALQAGSQAPGAPVLTLPVGR